MAENKKLFWDHLQHHICLTLNNSSAFYTWAHTWLGIKCPQSLSLTMLHHSNNTCVDTAGLCCIFWDPRLTVLCAHSSSCMFLICKGYIQNFSLWYTTICLFVFVKWVFTTSPGLMSSFWGSRDSSGSTSDIIVQSNLYMHVGGFVCFLSEHFRGF